MKKKYSDFPWYLIYTPLITVYIILWYLDKQTGDGSMDILEKVLRWLGLDDTLTSNALIVAIALIALLYIVIQWLCTNHALKNIEKVTKTAPENISEYVDTKHESLSKSISDASDSICKTISDDKIHFAEEITAIKTNVGSLVSQRPNVPVQQGQLLSEISSLYALHDRDQATINSQKEKINRLKVQNADLKQRNAYLQQKLDELTPKQKQTLTL